MHVEAREAGQRNKGAWPVLVIIGTWVLIAILIDPRGGFPLNDDWCYGPSAVALLTRHEISFVGATAVPLIAQVVWGALFCAVLGPSNTTLRLSTLALGLIGLLALYGLLKEARLPRWMAVFGCLVVGLNPLYLSLSYTFMTDVPCTAVALAALYFYVRALKRDSSALITAGTALACTAILIRQVGVVVPVAFAVGYLVRYGARMRSLVRAGIPVIIGFATLIGFQKIMSAEGLLPPLYGQQGDALGTYFSSGLRTCLAGFLIAFRSTYLYLGLFLAPFLIVALPQASKTLPSRFRRINLGVAAVSFVAVMTDLILEHRWMPINNFNGNVLYDFGLGPPTLRDVFTLHLRHLPTAPHWLWVLVTIISSIGGAMLVWFALSAVEMIADRKLKSAESDDKGVIAMMLTGALLYVAPIVPLTLSAYFDRYVLLAIPLLVVMAALLSGSMARVHRGFLAVGLAFAFLMGVFSVGATHDYLSWNRARWDALDALIRRDLAERDTIDGGYEFNAVFNDKNLDEDQRRVGHDEYDIAFGPTEGFRVLETYSYPRWMPPGEGTIYALRRK